MSTTTQPSPTCWDGNAARLLAANGVAEPTDEEPVLFDWESQFYESYSDSSMYDSETDPGFERSPSVVSEMLLHEIHDYGDSAEADYDSAFSQDYASVGSTDYDGFIDAALFVEEYNPHDEPQARRASNQRQPISQHNLAKVLDKYEAYISKADAATYKKGEMSRSGARRRTKRTTKRSNSTRLRVRKIVRAIAAAMDRQEKQIARSTHTGTHAGQTVRHRKTHLADVFGTSKLNAGLQALPKKIATALDSDNINFESVELMSPYKNKGEILWHGTESSFLPSIAKKGLVPGGTSGVVRRNGAAHGVGVYLSPNHKFSLGYSLSGTLLLCEVSPESMQRINREIVISRGFGGVSIIAVLQAVRSRITSPPILPEVVPRSLHKLKREMCSVVCTMKTKDGYLSPITCALKLPS